MMPAFLGSTRMIGVSEKGSICNDCIVWRAGCRHIGVDGGAFSSGIGGGHWLV